MGQRRTKNHRIFIAMLFVLACTPTVLQTEDEAEELPAPSGVAHAQELKIPSNYHGPIDPQWPPTRSSELEVELSTNRLILQYLEKNEGSRKASKPRVIINTSKVYAERGKIGGFEYIEVILGERGAPDEDLALAVLLHGRGGRPTIPPGPYLTDRPLRLFIPQGPDRLGDGYHWLATWTNSGKEELLARSLAARADELAVAIKAFSELRPTLGRPMLVGFSQGGILCFGLAIRHPTLFSAVFPIAGWLPPSLIPNETDESIAYPLIYAQHGGTDRVVGVERAQKTADLLRLFGFPIEFEVYPEAGHEVTRVMNQNVRARIRALSRRFFEARNQSLRPEDDAFEPEFWPVPEPEDELEDGLENGLDDGPAPAPLLKSNRTSRQPAPPQTGLPPESEPSSEPEEGAYADPRTEADHEPESESEPGLNPEVELNPESYTPFHVQSEAEPDDEPETEPELDQ